VSRIKVVSEDQGVLFADLTGYEATQFGAVIPEDPDAIHRSDRQRWAVMRVMSHREWLTLEEIAERIGAPIQSVSARVRDLRKAQYGGHTVDKALDSPGLWRYRLTLNTGARFDAWTGDRL
jgi:hypothetical protein